MSAEVLAPMPSGKVSSVVFFGTPEVAARVLKSLISKNIMVDLVVTRPDAKRGRGSVLSPSAVREVADHYRIPVTFEPSDALLLAPNPTRLGVVVAYGKIIRSDLLQALPMVNLHFSQLPRWRGAAPVERAILEGDETIGVDLMRVAAGLDEGDVFDERVIGIRADHTVESLRNELADIGSELLTNSLENGFRVPSPQVGEPIYAHKITKAELVVDWRQPAERITRQIRIGGGSASFRGSSVKLKTAVVVNVEHVRDPGTIYGENDLLVATGKDALRVQEIQPAGKPVMNGADWLRGLRLLENEKFDVIEEL